ncbi:MAG TPA: mechanosensitive ion channel family protein [Candidatus Marinimicrobia bacterium]|nr:mechanosensitive ion channel family protein [Candidatus Neomarinimicrobiota bacterium]
MEHFKDWLAHLPEIANINWLALSGKLLTILFILVMARLLYSGIEKGMRRFLKHRAASGDAAGKARLETIMPLISSVFRYVIYFIALLLALSEAGVDTSALLASAGVLGLAVGFGAQNLVRDFISGFFIYFDGLIETGDVITTGSITGSVERIDLRNTMVREFGGRLWSIPNGDIRSLGNFNRGWSRAVVEVGVAYEQPVALGIDNLKEIAEKWADENPDIWLEKPEVQAILALGDSAVSLRIVVKVKPMQHWATERELRRRIKDTFDEKGVEIPFPRQLIYTRKDKA